ncbi:MAG: glycosyltransferase [Niabella sp.]
MLQNKQHRIKVLVAPLDWGLGHTTRCIPIIYELLSLGIEITVAGNTIQQTLLKKEFANLKYIELDGYNILYSTNKKNFAWKILQQSPGIIKAIKNEHEWLNELIENRHFDAVISDNRFGLYHEKIPCIFITHQLLIKNKFGNIAEKILQNFNYKYINQFSECWIPDYEQQPNLGNALSHPAKMPKIISKYLGALTRIQPMSIPTKKDHLLIILSGPEPQRGLFEKMLLQQIPSYKGSVTIVRGLPASTEKLHTLPHITIHNHLSGEVLNREICKAAYIVCRSGYSSVMDLINTNAIPVLVPTPGQPEQEYLAESLSKAKFCITAKQNQFSLTELLSTAQTFNRNNEYRLQENNLKKIIQGFVLKYLIKK